jgi:hypothetical protein
MEQDRSVWLQFEDRQHLGPNLTGSERQEGHGDGSEKPAGLEWWRWQTFLLQVEAEEFAGQPLHLLEAGDADRLEPMGKDACVALFSRCSPPASVFPGGILVVKIGHNRRYAGVAHPVQGPKTQFQT